MAYWGEVEVIENWQDYGNAITNVTVNYYACSDTFAGWSNYTTYPFCGIYFGSGQVEETKTLARFDFRSSKKILLGSITTNIPHEADGTKTITATLSWDSDHSLVGTITASKSQALTTIPRASKITAVDANIESATTININRASSNFTHTITYAFEGLSGTIATKTSDTSVGFQIPASFYAKIPNSKTGTVTLTCTTYNGDTVIGTSTTTFTVTASEEKCKPDISATLIDSNKTTVAFTEDSSKLIKYKSTAKITPTATAKNSATIKSIAVNGYAVSGSYIAFENTQSETFTVVVTDSRGYTNTLELKPTVIQYIPLSATAKFDRLSATSSEVKVKYSGNYYNGSLGSANNSLTINWAYKEKDASSWITGGILTPTIKNNTFSGEASLGKIFNYKTAYDFILYVSDKLSAVNPQETVKKGETIYDYGVDANGNNYFNVNAEYYKNNEKLMQKNILTYATTQNQSLSANEWTKLQLDEIISQVGDKLTVSDNGIKIGKGISKVKINAIVWLETQGYRWVSIFKNNTAITSSISPEGGNYTGVWGSVSLPDILIDVEENDIIYLKANCSLDGKSTAGNYRPTYYNTYLTVEVVE